MSPTLPPYYFRIRDNGAAVFRVDTENRSQRIEMTQIAVANTNRGDYKPQGDHILSGTDKAAIEAWLAERMAILATRDMDTIQQTIDHMNLTAHWVQSKATDDQLETLTDELLLALHDLRSVLVRKKADRLSK